MKYRCSRGEKLKVCAVFPLTAGEIRDFPSCTFYWEEGVRKGERMEQMAQKLDAYQQERVPGGYQPGERPWINIITWYIAHFKKKGMAWDVGARVH